MSCQNTLVYLMVAATLNSFMFCYGQDTEIGDSSPTHAEREEVVSLRSGKTRIGTNIKLGKVEQNRKTEETSVSTNGSLAFDFDNQADEPARSSLDRKLKRMEPSVHCNDSTMSLRLKRGRAHFLVDSGEGSLIPLSEVPSHCGFSMRRARRDVTFVAPYRGCYVTQQDGNYVLPLRLWGAPASISCPVIQPISHSSVSCFSSGMVVKMVGISSNEVKVKVYGVWKPLSSVCDICGIVVESHYGGLTITVPYYKGLCTEIKDGEYSLTLHLADGVLVATCPAVQGTISKDSESGQSFTHSAYPQHSSTPSQTHSLYTQNSGTQSQLQSLYPQHSSAASQTHSLSAQHSSMPFQTLSLYPQQSSGASQMLSLYPQQSSGASQMLSLYPQQSSGASQTLSLYPQQSSGASQMLSLYPQQSSGVSQTLTHYPQQSSGESQTLSLHPQQSSGVSQTLTHYPQQSSGESQTLSLHPQQSSGVSQTLTHYPQQSSGESQTLSLYPQQSSGASQMLSLYPQQSSGASQTLSLYPQQSSAVTHIQSLYPQQSNTQAQTQTYSFPVGIDTVQLAQETHAMPQQAVVPWYTLVSTPETMVAALTPGKIHGLSGQLSQLQQIPYQGHSQNLNIPVILPAHPVAPEDATEPLKTASASTQDQTVLLPLDPQFSQQQYSSIPHAITQITNSAPVPVAQSYYLDPYTH